MKKLLLITCLLSTLSLPLWAETDKTPAALNDSATLPTGEDVARLINSRDEGVFVSRKLSLLLSDKRGKTRHRETMSYRKYYAGEKRTVIFYLSPKNVKGTAFLTYDYEQPEQEDDQWLYLPALRKVRRISAADRGDYFLGTDMTYEDIKLETRVSTTDFTFHTVGPCEINGFPGVEIEGQPIDQARARELGYSKTRSCVDKAIWMVRRSQFWDIKGELLKTVDISGLEKIQGIWTQKVIHVENHKTGHRTQLTFNDVDYQRPVADDIFTTQSIKRGL